MPTDIDAFQELRFLTIAGPLFDALPDVVFFVKDHAARYIAANETLVRRCGVKAKGDLLGKTAEDVFPAPMGRRYLEEDKQVLTQGNSLRDLLELHLYAQGGAGWCITTKLPLRDDAGAVIGIVGVSNDIHAPAAHDSGFRELAEAVQYIQAHISEPLRLEALATLCGLSVYQFEQRMKKVFQITAGQFISKTRIDAARQMLRTGDAPIAEVGLDCGFSDQSAFTRQFKLTTGLTPSEYRQTPAA